MSRKNHPGSIEERAGTFRVRLCVAGERHYFTLDPDEYRTLEDAQAFARSKYDDLRQRNGRGLPGPMRFSELLNRYENAGMPGKRRRKLAPQTKRSYRTSLQAFRTFFVRKGGDPKVHEIRKGHVNGFMQWRERHAPDGNPSGEMASARTVAKDRTILHRLFGYAEGLEIVEGNPVAKTDAPQGDKREPIILSGDQYEALLKACEGRPMLALYVLVLGETGVRCDSEALWLRWQDIDFERGFLTVESVRKGRRTKSGKSRKVPMTLRLRDAMREHAATYRLATYHGRRSEWVFHHELDRRHAKAGTRLGGLRRAFTSAAERAELPSDLRQHDLRHRRVTTWLATGKPIAVVAKAMGHSTVKVTEGYLHLVDNDLVQLVEDPEERELRALAEG